MWAEIRVWSETKDRVRTLPGNPGKPWIFQLVCLVSLAFNLAII